tara:strand:+ start:417 stop:653 length:237 start_codon:yes stop_codon:yes gene_type:complete
MLQDKFLRTSGTGAPGLWVKNGSALLMWGGLGLIYAGLGFPGSKKAIATISSAINQPKRTAEVASLAVGTVFVLSAKK